VQPPFGDAVVVIVHQPGGTEDIRRVVRRR
jgi:hypothetical protein